MITRTDRYEFNNLADLRDWLNGFKTTDLTAILPIDHADYFTLHWEREILTDGSEVVNVRLGQF